MKKIFSINNLFLLIIFSMPLYLVHVNIFGLPTNIFEMLAMLSIIIFLVKKRSDFIKRFRELPKYICTSILLVLIGVLISILFNNAYATGFSILKSWFLIPIIFSYLLYNTLDSESAVEKVFMSIYFSAALVGLIGIIYKIAGSVTYDNRLEAFYLSPNYLSMYLSPGIFFGFYFLIKSFRNKSCSYRFFTNIVLLTFIFIPLYYTYSYGAWLAIFMSFLILIVLFANKKHLPIAGAVVIITMLIFIFQINSSRFSNLFTERSSLASRKMIWNASTLMIRQHPLLGIGSGNFQTTYLSLQKYFPPYLEWAVPQPHNLFLAFWIQAGILGLIGFVLLLFFTFRALLSALKNKKGAALAAPVLGFFIYTVLHGLVDTPYWKNDLSFLFWICIFLTLSIYNISKSKAQ